MTFEHFYDSLIASQPPLELTQALAGLWWDAKGDWKLAHERAQEDESPAGSWLHAYLHRKEGDAFNAGYWYRRARKPAAKGGLEQEWAEIAGALLAGG